MTSMTSNMLIWTYSGAPMSHNEPHEVDYEFMTEWKSPEEEVDAPIIVKQSFVVEEFMNKDAKAYSRRMNLHNSLRQCINCIVDIFQEFALNGVFYKKDYDSNDEWLVIDIDSEGNLDELLVKYSHYTTMVNRSLPYESRKLIRFNFHPQ